MNFPKTNEHLSDFEIDLMLGTASTNEAMPSHLRFCQVCQKRWSQISVERERVLQASQFYQTFEKLQMSERLENRRPSRQLFSSWAGALSFAAVLLVMFSWPTRNTLTALDRTKGTYQVALRAEKTNERVSRIRTGDSVCLEIGADDLPWVIVMSRDGSGNLVQVWPVNSIDSGRVARRRIEMLAPCFDATPGSFELLALFSPQPLSFIKAQSFIDQQNRSPAQNSVVDQVAIVRAQITVESP